MDQYTSDLLTKWGLVEYVDTFSAARIDFMTLQLLEPNDIRLLISPIGDQLRFKSNFELWKREMNVCTANVDAEALNTSEKLVDLSFSSGLLLDLDNVTDENTNNNDKNTVLAILNKTPEGRAIVVKGERNGGLLSPELRKEIANLIINHELGVDRSKIITGPEFLNFAHEIKAIFKEESPAVFYAPYLAQTNFQPKRNASGLLYNAYGTKKKHLRQLGALPPASRSRSRSRSSVRSDTPETYLPLCGIQLSLLDEGEARIVEDKLLLLESPVPGPWQSVEEIWTETTAARLRFLYYEKGTLNDYLERFPVLKSASGYKLLIKDYEKLYPNKSNGLTVLLDSAKRIVQLANSKLSSIKDAKVKLTIKEYIESIDTNVEDSELNACLLLLAYIINITPVRRKNSWKASRTEFRDGFITHVASESDVLASIDERRIKLRDLGVTFQPLVIYCGESIKTIQKVFVVCETTLYEFQSLSKGVDTAFKIFHATGSQYPQESYDIWLLIQIAFYEVQTKYDRPTAAVKQTLVDLGLKNRLK